MDNEQNQKNRDTGQSGGPAEKAKHSVKAEHSVKAKSSGKAKETAGDKTGKPSSAPRRWPRRLLLLIVLVVLAGAAYLGWQHYGDRLSGLIADEGGDSPPAGTIPSARLDKVSEELSALRRTIEGDRAARESLESRVADLQSRLDSQAVRLEDLAATSRDDWLLAEAEYLLRLANQRLLTERQAANALALMERADLILRDIDDVDLFPVRKALAEDITALKMAGTVDREGLYLRIEALQGAVADLTLLFREPVEPEPAAAEPAPPEGPWYRRLWANAGEALADMGALVRIRRRDQPLEPLPTVEQAMNLRYNLRILLEQAQLALLRGEQQIYARSLGRARQWLEEHFAANAATDTVLDELSELRAQDIAPSLPAVSGSLHALQDYIELRHNRHRSAADGEPST